MTPADDDARSTAETPASDVPAIEARAFGYTFPGQADETLRDLTFTIPAGSFTLVAGETGSGKSTLLRAIAGLIPRHSAGQMSGQVALWGLDTKSATIAELATRVGIVLQSPDEQLCATAVEGEIAFGLENLGLSSEEIDRRIGIALRRVGLETMRFARTEILSGGQKQRLVLASILAMGPRLIVLDEPLRQLDMLTAAGLIDLLNELNSQGITIVLAEHRLDELLTRADRLLVLQAGRLVSDCSTAEPEGMARALRAGGLEVPELTLLVERLSAELPARDSEKHRSPTHGSPTPSASIVTAKPDRTTARLEVSGVHHRYTGSQRPTLRDVSFTIFKGQRIALVGANGSGKSTLLAMIGGQSAPTRGTISKGESFHGSDSFHGSESFRGSVGLVLQHPELMFFLPTVGEEIRYGAMLTGATQSEAKSRVRELARRFRLEPLLEEPPLATSHGERLRTAVAATLATRPGILLLDEPTTGQDPHNVANILNELHESLGNGEIQAVLFATHDLQTVCEFADRVLVLVDGELVADTTPKELLRDQRLLARAMMRLTPLLEFARQSGCSEITLENIAVELSGSSPPIQLPLKSEGHKPRVVSQSTGENRPSAAVAVDVSRGTDPRLKIVALLAISWLAIVIDGTVALGILALLSGWGLWCAKVPRTRLVIILVTFALLIWGTVFAQAMFYADRPRTPWLTLIPPIEGDFLSFPGIRIYREGVWHGLSQSLRLLAAACAGVAVTLSTSPQRLLILFSRHRGMAGLGFMILAALRFLPEANTQWILVRRARRLREAPRASPEARTSRHRFRGLSREMSLLEPVLLGMIRRGRTLATSASARGFDPGAARSAHRPLKMSLGERLLAALIVFLVATMSVSKLLLLAREHGLFYHPALRPWYALTREWL